MSLVSLSKYMCLILRHHPEEIGITLDEHGWAEVDELIAGIAATHHMTGEMLELIVQTDEKQRYSFNEDKTLIRANQGHSVPVDVELEKVTPPPYLWHGTGKKYAESINRTGLDKRSRLYVHLSGDTETAVKVGQRHGSPVLYLVKSGEMEKAGYDFFRSKNGVWLTKTVPVQFLEQQSFGV